MEYALMFYSCVGAVVPGFKCMRSAFCHLLLAYKSRCGRVQAGQRPYYSLRGDVLLTLACIKFTPRRGVSRVVERSPPFLVVVT